jgi:hypothetical protein
MDISLLIVVCRPVDVSASGWSLEQRSSTECGVSEYDREASLMKRPWSTYAVAPWKRTKSSSSYSSDEVVGIYVELIVVRSWYCSRNCVAELKINTKNRRIVVFFDRDSNLRPPDDKAEALNTTPTCRVILVVTDVLRIVN